MSRLPLSQKAGYGVGDFALNLVWQAIMIFLIFFYTDVAGLSPEWAGLVYIAASVWDAVTDPIMGGIADRTRTRSGRYRPYLLWGAVPLALSYWLAFTAPPLTGAWLVAWAMAAHVLLRTTYTVVSIPYSSLTARLTPDSNERARLTGWRMQFAVAGGLTLAVGLPLMVGGLGGGDDRFGYSAAIGLFALVFCVTLLVCHASTREPGGEAAGGGALRPAALLGDVLGVAGTLRANGPLMRLFITIIVSSICLGMLSKNVPYYFKYVYGDEDMSSPALGVLLIAMFASIPGYVAISRATSKRTAWIAGNMVMAAGLAALFANSLQTPFTVLPIFVLIGLGAGSIGVMFWSMLPDTVEYHEWVTGHRSEAKLYAFASFATKLASGIAGLLFGVLLGGAGFVANTVQSADTLRSMMAIMCLIPIAGLAACSLIIRGYPIDQKRHAELLRALGRSP